PPSGTYDWGHTAQSGRPHALLSVTSEDAGGTNMRARPLTLLTAAAAVTLVVAAGCEAKVAAKAYDTTNRHSSHTHGQPQTQLLDLLLRAIRPPGQPIEALPSPGFRGLQARIQRATYEAAASGATLSVAIFDRASRQLISSGDTQIIATASVAKLFIADELLLQESRGQTT